MRLRPKTFDLLCELVRRSGRVVPKSELFAAVWGADVYLSDDVLTQAVGELRRALGDTSRAPRFIETLHRRGYRWRSATVMPTEPDDHAAPPAAAPPPSRSRRAYWKGAAAVALAALAVPVLRPVRPPAPAAGVLRVAVLDLEPAQPEARWVGDAIAELLASDLARLPDVALYSRARLDTLSRDLQLAGPLTSDQLAAVGRYLDADFVVAGACSLRGGHAEARLVLHAVSGGPAQALPEGRFQVADLAWKVEGWSGSLAKTLRPRAESLTPRPLVRKVPIEVFRLLATARRLLKSDPERALQLLDEAVELAPPPQPAPLHEGRADALCALGRSAEAVEAARRARDLQPRHRSGYKEVKYLLLAGRPEEALTVLAGAVSASREPEPWLDTLDALVAAGRPARALAVIEELRPVLVGSWPEAELALREAAAARAIGDARREEEATRTALSLARRRGQQDVASRALASSPVSPPAARRRPWPSQGTRSAGA